MRTALLALTSACCVPSWTVNTSAVAAATLATCDYAQTVNESNNGQWNKIAPDGGTLLELNPVLGQRPSMGALFAWWALDMAAIIGANLSPAPRWAKLAAFGAVTAVEGYLVVKHWRYAPNCGAR